MRFREFAFEDTAPAAAPSAGSAATQSTEPLGASLGRYASQLGMAVTDTYSDVVNRQDIQRLQSTCDSLLPRIVQALVRVSQDPERVAAALQNIRVNVHTDKNAAAYTNPTGVISIDYQRFKSAPDTLVFIMGHEIGHILDHRYYHPRGGAGSEVLADDVATVVCKALGINKVTAFKYCVDQQTYSQQTAPGVAQDPNDRHPPLRSRIDRAQGQGLDLSKADDQLNHIVQNTSLA